jgi:hypothetical protein
LVPSAIAGVYHLAWSSDKSCGFTWYSGASGSKVSGSTNLTHSLFLALSGLPLRSLIGVSPIPLMITSVPPILGPECGLEDEIIGSS